MPDTQNAENSQVEEKANEEVAEKETSTTESGAEETSTESSGQKEEGFDALPEHWQKEISKLRKEAASRRTQKNDLENQLREIQEAGDPSEQKKLISQLQSQLEAASLEAKRAQIARDANLPLEFDVLLTGNNEEVLAQQAKALAQIASGSSSTHTSLPQPQKLDPKGGREPNATPPPSPSELLKQARAQRGRMF